ncbi:MAE_28990/MAE_18760 family HEPN-like nuclease [Stakelama flava]|uniref:MAE_28990/MAE_18760 family HEPN-like nuclease n=1 Tax=Stakelama flava TaxID=2860338 RepID=UPI001C5A7F5C
MLNRQRGGQKSKAFTRAGVGLLYAHWEGFVKRSAELYVEYISNRGLKYKNLTTCFVVFGPLVEEVLDLMRLFKNDLLNAAATEAYKKTA